MTQTDRDRLLVLKKAQKGLITQRQTAAELDMTERHIRRLLGELKAHGDQVVVHGLRGRRSNRKLSEEIREKIVQIISKEYPDFGPTFAAEQLAKRHQIHVGKETLRGWMIDAGLWKSKAQTIEDVHVWRPRRTGFAPSKDNSP